MRKKSMKTDFFLIFSRHSERWRWIIYFDGFLENYYDEEEVDEYYLEMFYRTEDGAWYWNDIAKDILEIAPYYSGRVGYIIEYGE